MRVSIVAVDVGQAAVLTIGNVLADVTVQVAGVRGASASIVAVEVCGATLRSALRVGSENACRGRRVTDKQSGTGIPRRLAVPVVVAAADHRLKPALPGGAGVRRALVAIVAVGVIAAAVGDCRMRTLVLLRADLVSASVSVVFARVIPRVVAVGRIEDMSAIAVLTIVNGLG